MPRLPACTPAEVIRALTRAGFFLDHSTGAHLYFRHPGRRGIVGVPFHRRDLKHGTLTSLVAQAGLSPADFLKLI